MTLIVTELESRLETSASPNKKHKSLKESVGKNKTKQVKTGNKTENSERTPLNKDSVLVIISEILDNTYYNAIKMENMVLAAFPQLKESGMWTKYRVNKRHKNKCYITLPKNHHKDNVTNIIRSQVGFQECKVDVKLGINDVPTKAYTVLEYPSCLYRFLIGLYHGPRAAYKLHIPPACSVITVTETCKLF